MDNAIRQEIKEEIIEKLNKNVMDVLKKYEIKQQVMNKIVSEITILSILAMENNLN